DHAEVRVHAEAGDEHRFAPDLEPHEVVAVVEVAITRADVSHRLGGLMNGIVVEVREHGGPWGGYEIVVSSGATSLAKATICAQSSSQLRALNRTWSWFTPSAAPARICSAMDDGVPVIVPSPT